MSKRKKPKISRQRNALALMAILKPAGAHRKSSGGLRKQAKQAVLEEIRNEL